MKSERVVAPPLRRSGRLALRWLLVVSTAVAFACAARQSSGESAKDLTEEEVARATDALPEGATAQESASWVLDQAEQAVGHISVSSRYTQSTITASAQGLIIEVEAFQLGDDKAYARQKLPGMGVSEVAYDGNVGWSRDPMTGLRQRQGAELEEVRRMTLAYEQSYGAAFSDWELKGVGVEAERVCYEVSLSPHEGADETHFIDAQTFLTVRMDQVSEGVQGRMKVRTWIEEYQEVDGVLIPWALRSKVGPIQMTTRVNSVSHGVEIDPTIFTMPME